MSSLLDSRSQKNLETLRLKARPWFTAFLLRAKALAAHDGLEVRILSGNRTWAEQETLYAQGRTTPGSIVTNARGGQSNHNFGIAVDIGVFAVQKVGKVVLKETYQTDHALYHTLGPIGEAVGLEWGGHWNTHVDLPHYQIPLGRSVGQLRDLVTTSGWTALDALIPPFKDPVEKAPTETPRPSAPVGDTVVVYLDTGAGADQKLSLDAWYQGGRTWVALSDWCDYFGGTIAARTESTAILHLGSASVPVVLQTLSGRTAAPFGEVNGLQHWDHSFDGIARPRRLTIHRRPHPE